MLKVVGSRSLVNAIITSLILIVVTIASFSLLTSSVSHAETTSANASIIVPVSCNMSSTLDSAHTATITPGTSQGDIGTTTFKVTCNDAGGYSVYAVGYSNEENGNTKLLATVGGTLTPTYDIVTGTATSGDTSNWAMKLNPVAGTYAPTIESDTNGSFSNYHIVPDKYTKVATFPSTTDLGTGASGSSFQSTYQAYISGTQPAGTYAGKVKYTMVHPASEKPVGPEDATPGCISYWPNTSGVTDSMGDQCSFGNNATVSDGLWASNFKRDGYGFAGWSDKYDWKINENDENGNGTGANAGYHIYGPNATITTPSDMTDKGLSLYAVWVPNAGNLQSWNQCSLLNVGDVTALTDTRDNMVYAVAKLKDNNCWMIENLRLADKKPDNTPITLSSTNTNKPISTFTQLSASQNPTSTAWCTTNSTACYDQSMLYTGNTTNSVANMTGADANIYSYGNYYNWYSATAGNGTYSFSTENNSVAGSICPAGWNLPKGGNKNNTTSSDFWKLGVAITGAEPANTSSQKYPYYTGTPEGANASNKFRSYPNNFVYSGRVYGSSVANRSMYGYCWSSTADYTLYAYTLAFDSNYVGPGTNLDNKNDGFMARCIVSGL